MSSVTKAWLVFGRMVCYSAVLTTYTQGESMHSCFAAYNKQQVLCVILSRVSFMKFGSNMETFICNPKEDCRFKSVEYRRIQPLTV